MKTASDILIDLADSFTIKYAANQTKKDVKGQRCTCEQTKCHMMGAHEPAHCKGRSSGKASMYLGAICDDCAQFLDTQYLID